MIHDIRWILIFAWPFSIAVGREIARAFWPKDKRATSTATLFSAVGTGIALLVLYRALAPSDADAIVKIEEEGAFLQIDPAVPAFKTDDGNYTFRVGTQDTGHLDIAGSALILRNTWKRNIITPKEEDDLVQDALDKLKPYIPPLKNSDSTASYIPRSHPEFHFIPKGMASYQYNEVMDGEAYVYVVVAAAYVDQLSLKFGKYYLATICGRYVPDQNVFRGCLRHNERRIVSFN